MIHIGRKIRALRTSFEENQAEFARRVGSTQPNVSRWEKGSMPEPEALVVLAALAGQTVETFLGEQKIGPVEPGKSLASAKVPERGPAILDFLGDEYAAVVRFDLYASAGPGAALPETAEIKDRLLFRLDWLRRRTRAMLEEIGALTVIGDSMRPTLENGDVVLVDMTQNNPARDDIYVIQRDGLLLVKRLKKSFKTKTLTIISDNPAYGEEPGVDPESVNVIGRVFWMGRQL